MRDHDAGRLGLGDLGDAVAVVEGFDGDEVLLLGPLAGRVREDVASLDRRWGREAIWCD